MSFKKFLTPLVFLFLISLVSAANVCCEKTKSGDYCLYTDELNCAPNSKSASITCEQTSFCKVGCCYNSDEGRCFKNTPKAECDSMKTNTWDSDQNCGIQQCNKGCCMIGNEAFFVTQVRCKAETSLYPNVTMTFDENILTEQECIAKSRAEDKGCCVSGTECKFATRGACATASIVQIGNETGDGFYSGMLCSNDKLKCDCAKQQTTGCLPGEDGVYWFDSCGNRENIYSSDKVASYNNGYVLPEGQGCKLKGANDPNCGNCDYSSGTLCGPSENDVNMKFGDYTCRDVNCKKIYDDDVSPNSGSSKKNGESWCIFDTLPGKARDTVGSRHFRYICINGEELIEPCRDFREEICIQGVMHNEPAETAHESFSFTGDYVEAACRDNRWEDCFSCNSAGDDAKKCCEDFTVRDCFWLRTGLIFENVNGICVPDVPPGFAFWPAELERASSSTRTPTTRAVELTGAAVSTASGTSTISGGGGSSVCSEANSECTVAWKRGGVSRLLGKEDWDCIANCHCTEHSWIVAGNTLCKSMGDCGAKFNIVGEVTTDGYANTASSETKFFTGSELTESEAGDWDTVSHRGAGVDVDDSKSAQFKEFFKKSGLSLGVMAGSGLYTGFASGWIKGSFMSGALGGLKTIGNSVGWLFSLGKGGASTFTSTWATTYGTQTFNAGQYLPKDAILAESEALKFGSFQSKEALKQAADAGSTITKNPDGTYKILQGDTFKVPQGQTVTTQTSQAFSNTMGLLNTVMWIYTIYQLVDVFYAQTKDRTYSMSCGVWVAPDGGDDCEKCNEDNNNKPCSEYRCKSLGKLCSLVNQGTSEEKCINLHPNDVTSPILSPWKDVLSKGFTLTEVTAEGNKGFKINEKLKPFQSITIGIKTDEPAQCKFDSKHAIDYDQKLAFFGDQLYKYEHEITFMLPSDVTTQEALKLTNGGVYNIYIRCKDASGNKNGRDYFIRFSIEAAPDLTAPVIERTGVENGAYAPFGVNETFFSVYTNEPADCRWNFNDTEFDLMGYKFTCADSGFSLSSIYYGLYECKTNLLINPEGSTDYYFRCKDRKGNVNTESYPFTLRSTKPLKIDSAGPSGIIYKSDVELKVITSGGAKDGEAKCGYSNSNVPFLSMIEFFETNSAIHKQPLVLDKGNYFYYVTCRDVAGNEAYSNITFKVDVDLDSPKIVYIYSEGSVLHLELNEPSNCQYSTNSTISYGSGIQMTGTDSVIHELNIDGPVYYIACIDVFENQAKFTVYV